MSGRDDAAFTEFVAASSPSLLHTAWLLCGDAHRAEDLVQETYVRLYRKWRSMNGQPWSYARKTLVNLNTDRWRSTRLEVVSGSLPEAGAEGDEAQVDARRALIDALSTLPRRERDVVVLRHYADLSELQVADLLGIGVGTVKSAGSRGLARLRTQLDPALEGQS
ncbi:RNA polymerase sigma-70 factor (sigma-E family) [Branchiibius hedensis]|uniref:RNA polymerase sigma-70 factor, sigma-E family n=1 Tax=Branchiibius hedensis TaxID=672460 RepID=A0A2Y9C217_9MICO|nr:SigE family RNA polymerase sigma factor [Branchiibius hedensis]PWJ26481.1 RNA polymerase sigma-70 factor (sigma-E family) [Branchiibius hedensis]SSA35293.1 RNA polymerase sigma-70 factor, sigma-E family [Branchiibius hedensis]